MSRVFLSNVDDYLGPSQACVNPLFSTDKEEKPSSASTSATTAEPTQNGTSSTAVGTGKVIPRQRRRRVQNIGQQGGPPLAQTQPTTTPNSSSSGIVKATIADCLACSGCVTTAETVLLEEQHSLQALQELIRKPAQERPMLVLTISPASWADLLRHILPNDDNNNNVNLLDRQRQLTSLFHQTLNISVVLDGNLPLQWALQESADEFCRSWRHAHCKNAITDNSDSGSDDMMMMVQVDPSRQEFLQQQLTPSRALSSTRTEYLLMDENRTEIIEEESSSTSCQRTQQALPVIASSCPAVVCLVEKSFHRAVPHLATTKSPMSLAGAWWKQQQQQSSSNTVFHVAVMPCYDKKLEASRKDFISDATGQKDVDMVITTNECLELVQQALKDGVTPSTTSLMSQPLAPVYHSVRDWVSSTTTGMVKDQCCLIASSQQQQVGFNKVLQSSSSSLLLDNNFFASGSGGYAAYIFCHAAKELFGVSLTLQDLIWTPVSAAVAGIQEQRVSARVASQQRRREYYEIALDRDNINGSYSLTSNNGSSSQPVLRFAVAYGMQTIQRALQPFSDESSINDSSSSSSSSSPSHHFDYMEVMACPSGCLNGGGQIRLAERETPTETRQRVAATQALFQTPSLTLSSSSSPLTSNGDMIPVQDLHTRYHVVPPLQYAQGAVAGVAVKDMQF